MKTKSLKSQITMLIIIGLVLFTAVSLILYLSKSAVKKQSQQGAKKAQEIIFEIQPVRDFVSKCLDKLAKDAITLVGKQGGQIYKSQGGVTPDCGTEKTEEKICGEGNLFVSYYDPGTRITYKVPYGIQAPLSAPRQEIYPSRTFPYSSETSSEKIFEGFYGVVFGRDYTAPLNYSGGSPNIQQQIESFIDNKMKACADFSAFGRQGIDIVLNSTRTSAVIGSSDVSISSTIPITITNLKTKESAQLKDFSANVNVRLKDAYFLMKDIADKDTRNIKFSIRSPENNRNSIKISIIENIYSNDDLVIITDEKSTINGRSFEYVFARKNRMPALYYIKNTDRLEFEAGHMITKEDLLQGQELDAEDPDEDAVKDKITIRAFAENPSLPTRLDIEQIKFRVEVSDGELSDYQDIIVKRKRAST